MAAPKRPLLTRQKVVDAAKTMIGHDGLELFSMPRLAKSLSVSTPSLYHHFADKNALLAKVARSVATPEPPAALPPEANWIDYLVSTVTSPTGC